MTDAAAIVDVDRAAWWAEVAFTEDQVRAQIESWADGVLVAEVEGGPDDGRIVGTTCGLRITQEFANRIHSWADATSNGYFKNHDPAGDVAFGANLSVLPEYQRAGVGDKLYGHGASVVVQNDIRYLVLGSRLPGLADTNNARVDKGLPRLSGEEYARLKDGRGRILDDELRFYASQPLMEVLAVLPNYFPDPQSENYGVLVRWWNPLYRYRFGWVYSVPLARRVVPFLVSRLVRVMV